MDLRYKGDFGRMENDKGGKSSYKGHQERNVSKRGEGGGWVLYRSCDSVRNNRVENKNQPIFALAL